MLPSGPHASRIAKLNADINRLEADLPLRAKNAPSRPAPAPISKNERFARGALLAIVIGWFSFIFGGAAITQSKDWTPQEWMITSGGFVLGTALAYTFLLAARRAAKAHWRRSRPEFGDRSYVSSAFAQFRAASLAPLFFFISKTGDGVLLPIQRTPLEVALLIESFLDGTDAWAWDELERPLTDPELEAYRQRAMAIGPPFADANTLRKIAQEVRSRYNLPAF